MPPQEREHIAEFLLLSLGADSPEEIEAAWAEEIKRRIAAIDNSEVQLIPADDVMREMRERLNG